MRQFVTPSVVSLSACVSFLFLSAACGSDADTASRKKVTNEGELALHSLIDNHTANCDGTMRLMAEARFEQCAAGQTIDLYTIEYRNLSFTVDDNRASTADQLNGQTFFADVTFGPESAIRDKRVRIRADCPDYTVNKSFNVWSEWQSPDAGGHSYYIEERDGVWQTVASGGYQRSSFQRGIYLLVNRPGRGVVIKSATCG